jgi:hypothetical protein
MSCPEIVSLYNAIRTDTNQRMGDYIAKLQTRYGDPRVYHAQQAEMRREEAGVMHDQGRRREILLEDAYKAQVQKNRQMHNSRFKACPLDKVNALNLRQVRGVLVRSDLSLCLKLRLFQTQTLRQWGLEVHVLKSCAFRNGGLHLANSFRRSPCRLWFGGGVELCASLF